MLLVISWSRDLKITDCTWFNHMNQFTRDLITSSFYPKILHASASSFSPLLWALLHIVVTISSFSYRLSHQSALVLSGIEVLRIGCELSKRFAMIFSSWEKITYRPTSFQIWWWWRSKRSIFMLYKGKPLEEEPRVKWWGDGWLDAARPDSWDVNISFYQAILAVELHCNVLW